MQNIPLNTVRNVSVSLIHTENSVLIVYYVHTGLSVVPNELMFLVYNFVPHSYML